MARRAWHRAWPWLRVAAGVLVIALVLRMVGAGAFVAGLRAIGARTVLAALAITLATTACCAWRWQLVIRAFGADLGAAAAIGAYYRSQFLDAALPGGVLGDVYRGVRRGVRVSNLGRGLRAVFWERVCGQVVQLVLTAAVLCVMPSPVQAAMPAIVAALAIAVTLAAIAAVRVGRAATRHRGAWRRALADLRALSPTTWLGITVASSAAVTGFVAIFVLAAHAVGVTLPLSRLIPLLMLALAAAAIPFNVAGFGPREGVAAWAFGAAGAAAHQGVAAATLYGILGLVAVAPGLVLLLLDWLYPPRRRRTRL